MSGLKLYNSLTRKKEAFKPQDPKKVTLYTCGPTVYGPSHLGHARSYVFFDLLKRALEFNDYKVKHVLNITDVHDSMIERAGKERISIQDLAERFIKPLHEDLEALNIEPAELYPLVTEHIQEIIEMVETLIKEGFAYEKDGSVYYDVSKFKGYGKLSGIKPEEQKSGTRVATDKYEKEEARDFALWKAAGEEEEKVGAAWDSPWGRGRPGWHIECSVMAKKHLGETIDIHAGALDLKFPHHENEIAQSEAATGKKFANYWIHGGLLTVEGQKMSKSLGNYVEFREIDEKGYNPLAFRYLCLTAHYQSELNFTWKALEAAQTALDRIYSEISTWDLPIRSTSQESSGATSEVGAKSRARRGAKSTSSDGGQHLRTFTAAVNDDLDLPRALTVLWEVVKDKSLPAAEKHRTLSEMDRVLGLGFDQVDRLEIPEEVRELIDKREQLRKEGKWADADEIRSEIYQEGFILEDTPEGPLIKPA